MFLRLFPAFSLLAVAALANPRSESGKSSPNIAPAPEHPSAYLFAHFTGESPRGEQIYFAVSEDGRHWSDLNNSEPVLISDVGEKGVRDPSLIRLADGKKFLLLATDLRIAAGRGWGESMKNGSTSLVFWESSDLVHWSKPWMVDVASAIPEAGCAWAPEAIYDESRGDYFVYWATISPREGERRARIYGSRTKDFRRFTAPELYIDRRGESGKGQDIIDTQIMEVESARRRFYRASGDGQITIEAADHLLGPWERIGDLARLGYTGKMVEGPILFKFNGQRKWGLFADQYATSRGYLPFETTNLDDPAAFQVMPTGSYSFGDSRKRHGGVLPITKRELDALRAKWPSQPSVTLAPLASPGRKIRHADFRLRLDADVKPAEDGRWRITPALSGEKGAVSIRSTNYPDRYIAATPAGADIAPDDGSPTFAARASFVRVPGLADADAISFRLVGSTDAYLQADTTGLRVAPARTEAARLGATFIP
jgi:hypothetical protein